MKRITLFAALSLSLSLSKAQLGNGLEGVIVEKYYLSNAADSANADNNGAVSPLHIGSTTYRVFIDMAPGWKFVTLFGNSDAQGNVLHPLIIRTSTEFYNDPTYGQVYPQGISVTNTKKNTTLIDSWLSVGGVCFGKMGVPKTEDPDGSIGNSNGVLLNNPGGVYGAPISSVTAQGRDGMMPGSPLVPTAFGLGNATDIFDQTPGGTFSVTNGAISGLGGVVGTTTSNVVLLGQFTTKGVFSFSLNVQIQNTVTGVPEVYVPSNPVGTEFTYTALGYSSAASTGTTTNPGDTTDVGIASRVADAMALNVYPNPAHQAVTIHAEHLTTSSDASITLYDITGRAVLRRELTDVQDTIHENVEIGQLSRGIYVVELKAAGIRSTHKLVKE